MPLRSVVFTACLEKQVLLMHNMCYIHNVVLILKYGHQNTFFVWGRDGKSLLITARRQVI